MALHHLPQHSLALLTGLALLAALGAPPLTLLALTATLGCAILAAVLREPRPRNAGPPDLGNHGALDRAASNGAPPRCVPVPQAR
ncbi:hypothetical protein SAMN04244553_6176 [Nocardia amikacinitolerans]|uniref:Uncharacterized protein n=1 Tax=Nocardia amikacinitolerans TaxID=756689 RepID=A0A285LW86_9NOCA|nr:hypothetical protein [Nocardia amikacinitolerans]SNY89170.1 hypothetical protein SAMN04244553_6176 [Nocardia amikacinitolerans]